MKKNIKIKFTALYDNNWKKFTPDESSKIGNCEFFFNDEDIDYDFWFVFDSFKNDKTTNCFIEGITLITGEPESVLKYNKNYIAQYSNIFTTV